jgi:hypothetical protein
MNKKLLSARVKRNTQASSSARYGVSLALFDQLDERHPGGAIGYMKEQITAKLDASKDVQYSVWINERVFQMCELASAIKFFRSRPFHVMVLEGTIKRKA